MTTPTAPRPRDVGNDATKGFLVALVALGHFVPAQSLSPWLSSGGLYDFHVIGFLLLPFLRPAAPFGVRVFADRAVRYFVPFLVFALLSFLAWKLTVNPAAAWRALPAALLYGDVLSLGDGVGFTFLWFLPALFSLTWLRSAIAVCRGFLHTALVLAVLLAHGLMTWPGFPLPFNPLPALFVLPIGWALTRLAPLRRGHILWLVLSVICGIVAARLHHHINIGALAVSTWRQPGLLLLHDVYALAATLTVIHFGDQLARIPGLVPIGRYSLVVYLSHQFVLKAVEIGASRHQWYTSPGAKLVLVVVAVPGSLALGWLLARLLERPAIRPWILPQSLRDWPVSARLLRLSQAETPRSGTPA